MTTTNSTYIDHLAFNVYTQTDVNEAIKIARQWGLGLDVTHINGGFFKPAGARLTYTATEDRTQQLVMETIARSRGVAI